MRERVVVCRKSNEERAKIMTWNFYSLFLYEFSLKGYHYFRLLMKGKNVGKSLDTAHRMNLVKTSLNHSKSRIQFIKFSHFDLFTDMLIKLIQLLTLFDYIWDDS